MEPSWRHLHALNSLLPRLRLHLKRPCDVTHKSISTLSMETRAWHTHKPNAVVTIRKMCDSITQLFNQKPSALYIHIQGRLHTVFNFDFRQARRPITLNLLIRGIRVFSDAVSILFRLQSIAGSFCMDYIPLSFTHYNYTRNSVQNSYFTIKL